MKTKLTTNRANENTALNFRSLPKIRRHVTVLALVLSVLGSLSFARSSVAVPLLFTLTGVTFDDGATAAGAHSHAHARLRIAPDG